MCDIHGGPTRAPGLKLRGESLGFYHRLLDLVTMTLERHLLPEGVTIEESHHPWVVI